VPYVPNITNIKEWNKQYPGRLNHSKYYRRPEDFADQKVIVVGNSASGADISAQVAAHCQQPLLWSSKSVSLFSATHSSGKASRREVPPIKRFILEDRGVEFEDGTIESDIDAIMFATGYFYSLPFLENVKPALITDGSHVNHTYALVPRTQPTRDTFPNCRSAILSHRTRILWPTVSSFLHRNAKVGTRRRRRSRRWAKLPPLTLPQRRKLPKCNE
jgi:lysine/ornithine N-monooxygenase